MVGILGAPAGGVTVTIGSRTVTSDTSGAFSVPDVTPPYDVTVSSAADNWAHVFVGLSSPTPTLLAAGAIAGSTPTASNATVAGTISTTTPIDATHPVEVCVEGVSTEVVGCKTLTTSNSYSITARWASTANVAVRLHALQMTLPSSDALPTGYEGYAFSSSSTTFVPGGSYSRNLTLGSAPSTTSISGTVTAPAGLTSESVLVLARLTPYFVIPLGEGAFTGTSMPYTAAVPAFGGSSYTILAGGSASGALTSRWRTGLTAGTGRNVTLAPLPTVTSPPSIAGPGDTFTVGNTGGAPLTVMFTPQSSSAPTLAVTTSQASVVMPSTLHVPSGSGYDWTPFVNPGETLSQASSDWLEGLYGLLTAGGLNVKADGGLAMILMSAPSFTVP